MPNPLEHTLSAIELIDDKLYSLITIALHVREMYGEVLATITKGIVTVAE